MNKIDLFYKIVKEQADFLESLYDTLKNNKNNPNKYADELRTNIPEVIGVLNKPFGLLVNADDGRFILEIKRTKKDMEYNCYSIIDKGGKSCQGIII
jgi:hypothetical protein